MARRTYFEEEVFEIARENYLAGLHRGYFDAQEDAWKMVVGNQAAPIVNSLSDGDAVIANADPNLTINQSRDAADAYCEAMAQRVKRQENRAENYVVERGEKHFEEFSDINREKRLRKAEEETKKMMEWGRGDEDEDESYPNR